VPNARFDFLLNLPEAAEIGAKVNDAMRDIEKHNPQLAGVLPKTYNLFTSTLLKELLKKISEADKTVCYIVEVPQSHTAHMARDHRYHKRNNFTTAHMEDYEVRDVMNRRTHPKIRASIFINRKASRTKSEGVILVKVENTGRVLAHHVMVELEVPLDLGGLINVEDPVTMEQDNDGEFFLVRLTSSGLGAPVFPDSYLMLRRKIHTQVRIEHYDGRIVRSRRYINVSAFADDAPALRARLEIAPVLAGWTAIEDTGSTLA
jgi:hypothetical protein